MRLAKALEWRAGELVAAGDWLRAPASIRKVIRGLSKSGGGGIGGGGGAAGSVGRRGDGAVDLDEVLRVGGAGAEVGEVGEGGVEGIALREVPMINRVAAGKASEYGDLDYPAGVADAYVLVPDLPGVSVKSAFAVRVVGDSMEPEYVEGDILIVGPGAARDGDDCVVRLGEGDGDFATTFKRVYFVAGAGGEVVSVRLVALNERHGERVVGMGEVSGIYPLIYKVRAARR